MSFVRHPASPKEAIMASDVSDLFIVDDNAMMRDALSVVFTLAGYRVTGFVDGETFLAVASDRGRLAARSAPAGQIRAHGGEGTGWTELSRVDLYRDGWRRCEFSCRRGEKWCVRLSHQAA